MIYESRGGMLQTFFLWGRSVRRSTASAESANVMCLQPTYSKCRHVNVQYYHKCVWIKPGKTCKSRKSTGSQWVVRIMENWEKWGECEVCDLVSRNAIWTRHVRSAVEMQVTGANHSLGN